MGHKVDSKTHILTPSSGLPVEDRLGRIPIALLHL
jgi:hypothetical protein